MTTKARAQIALLGLSGIAIGAFVTLFILRNQAGLSRPALIAALGLAYTAVYLGGLSLAAKAYGGKSDGQGSLILWNRVLLLLACVALIYLFLDNTVLDYYQPISLFDDVIALWALGWAALVFSLLMAALIPAHTTPTQSRYLLIPAAIALLGLPTMALIAPLNQPEPNPALSLHGDVFVGGEGGYRTYRIPGLLVLPAGSRLAYGQSLDRDRILAFAEARRDGALDNGVIDLVVKYSEDGGYSWSEQAVVCQYRREGKRGKCGNATPVFDSISGKIELAYNLSGIESRKHIAVISTSEDGGTSWSEPRTVATDNLVFGPGHGIQKTLAPRVGRLIIPGYIEDAAVVLYSDDHGLNWQRSDPLDTGNEAEVAELSDGRLYMTTRHRAPIGRPPQPNGRLYAHSDDGGSHWSDTATDMQLITPICQASVAPHGVQGGLLFSNPAHEKARVNMTLRYSSDDGERWHHSLLVYPGPSGYSELGVLSNGDILLLYERGSMSYSERISLARLDSAKLSP